MADPVLLAVLPVLTAIVGAGLAWLATFTTERAKWQRGQRARWDERRLVAYLEYATAVKREVYLCLRLAAHQGLGTMDVAVLAKVDGLAKLEQAEETRSDRFEALLLLGDPNVVDAARDWQSKVWNLHQTVDGTRTVDQQAFMALFREAGLSRDKFHKMARQSLTVKAELLASPEFQP